MSNYQLVMKNIIALVLIALASTYSFSQNTFTSNNAAPGTDFNNAANWTGAGTPSFVNGLDKFIIRDGDNYSSSGALTIDALTLGQGVGGGTLILTSTLVMEGNLLLDANSTLTAAANQINIAGNWTENGSGAMTSSGTVVFDAPLVQTISDDATFNNLTFSGGSVISTGGDVRVNGNWVITNNTNFSTGNSHRLDGNLTIDDGSVYNATNGRLSLRGSVDQALNIGTNATFDEVYFQPGAAIDFNITGNYVANDRTYVYPDATLNGAGDHTMQELIQNGTINFSGSITFTASRGYDTDDHVFTLGTADVIIDGYYYLSTTTDSDAITIGGDLTVASGYLVLDEGLVTGTAGKTLELTASTSIYLRGTDNFPTGFGTINLDKTSFARYDIRAVQTIRGGITYGRLYLNASSGTDTGTYTKTVDGTLDIDSHLYLYGGITLNLGTFNHTLEGYLYNNTNASITHTSGTFTLDAPDATQTMQAKGTGTYLFSTLAITNSAPTAVRTINIDATNINVTNFSVTNLGGSATNYLVLDIDANLMVGFGTYTIGSNVELRTSGSTEFNSIMAFYTESIDAQSTILYDGTTQTIAGVAYGHVEIRGNGTKTAGGAFSVLGNFTRVAETPVFSDGGFSHSVAGNWVMGTAYTSTSNMTGTMNFNGADQTISASNLNNVTFSGSGTKSLLGTLNVGRDVAGPLNGDFTINNGVTVDAGVYSIDMIGGHWVNGGTGVFTQNTGTVYFSSTQTAQNITSNSNNIFGNVHIQNDPARTVTAQTDIIVSRDFDLIEDFGDFNLQGFTLFVGRHFNYRTGTSFSFTLPGATLHFNGDTYQNIRNYAAGTYPNMTFSGLAEKYFYDFGLDIDGDVTITNTTLDGQWLSHTVAGNWNNGGSFQHARDLTFDGADQTISASTFHDTFYSGTGTKTLTGNISLNGRLQINDGVTLDVSASNYKITVEESWRNQGIGGVFVPRNGTVEFSGGFSQIFTGASGFPSAGKQFWDVLINTSTSRAELDGDLIVENDFNINAGAELETDAFDMYVEGSFVNSGTFDFNSNSSSLTFNGSSGTHSIDPGGAGFRFLIFDAAGAEYKLQSNLSFSVGGNMVPILTVNGGLFDLNGNEVLFSTIYRMYLDITGGTLEVDEGASLRLGRDSRITNSGGTFKIVGSAANPAVVNSLDPDVSDYYDYTQTGGTIEAQYYSISNTTGNGFDIIGGSIDATNNFSNGVFSNGAGTAYLTLDIPFNPALPIPNVIFNAGPSFNVSAPIDHLGALAVDFEDALGGLAGEGNDSDGFNQINWSFSGTGVYWDGGGDGLTWNSANNWSGNSIPIATDVVYLEHSTGGVVGAYSVDISTVDAVGLKLILDAEGADDISLTVKNGRILDIDELLTIIDGSLIQENSSTILLAGAFSNSGTYTANTNTFILDGTSGIHSFNTNTDPFYNLTVNASGAQYNLDNNMVITNDFNITDGIFNVVGNKLITISGNWSTSGGAYLPGTGEVRFSGNVGTQTIYGGLFYNLNIRNVASKQLISNATVEDDLTIDAGFTGVFDAQNYILNISDDWINNRGAAAFNQTGTGAVIFNGDGQLITGISTTFNSMFFSGTGTKIIQVSTDVNKDLNILSGITRVEIDPSVTVTGTAGGTLSQTGGQLRIEGVSNFPNSFGTINLSGGEVFYYSNLDQDIFATTYFDLRVGRIGVGTPFKTLLGDITVNDDISLNDNKITLAANNFTINLEDYISIPTGGQQINWGVAGGTGTLNHFGDWFDIDSDITGFNNLILNGSGTKYMRSPLAITGDVTINDAITLDMNGNTMTGVGTESFTMLGTSRVITDDIAAPLLAFPTAFGSYSLATTSRVSLNGAGDQVVYTTPTYGVVYVYSNGNATLDGNLDVDGYFYMNDDAILVDNGFDMNFSGLTIDIRDYTPTGGTTVTLDGADQALNNGDATSTDYLDFANIIFGGTGTKTLTGWQDHYRIAGDLTVNNSITVNTNRDLDFSGTNFTNNGTLNHTANTINFNATGVQTIDPGADHTLQTTRFENAGGTKTITGNGLNIDGGQIEFFSNATVDFGALTHNFAYSSVNDDNTETLITANANAIYDRIGTQTILKDREWNNITFAGTGNKLIGGVLTCNNLTVNNGSRLLMSSDYGTNIGGLFVKGNWANAGEFFDYTSTIAFESTDVTAKTIDNNGYDFYNVTFNQTDVNTRVYTLLSNQRIQEDLTIGSGATLDVNGFDLTLGNNDSGNPDAEQHVVEAGATLTITPGSSLLFDASDNGSDDTSDRYPTLVVDGTLNLIGTTGNLARIDRVTGSYQIDIDIQTGGTINARFYEISTLVDEGFDVQTGATVGAAPNNFSDGTWSGISTSGSGNRLYLNIEADATGLGDISNVTFNHSGTPVVGVHFNVRRSLAAPGGAITFAGTISGILAGQTYEDDGAGGAVDPGVIIWPALSFTNWTGTTSSDWSVVANWDNGVPSITLDAIIGLQVNNPIIDVVSGDANAKSLTLTNGILTIDNGNDLNLLGDIIIGQGSSSGILAVADATSDVFISGGLTVGTNGIYIPSDGTLTFNAAGGIVSIAPNNAILYGLTFTGGASYLMSGSNLDIDGDINITNGTLSFSTTNYTANIAGDMLNTGGDFSTSTAGMVVLDGANQTIKDIGFNDLTVSGTLTKTLQGSVDIVDDLIVNSTLNVGTATFVMNGDVTIEASGTFNDGNGSHTFYGPYWTGTGAYTGAGTIVFARTGTQYIKASKFNNLDIGGTGTKYLQGDTDLTGDLIVRSSIASLRLGTSLFDNTSGTGTFTTEAGRSVFILGADNYPSGFATYAPDATSLARYEGTIDQTIRGVQYGRLYLVNSTTKTLSGDIDVDGDLDFNTAILDVSASNYEIKLAAEWDNNNGGSFIARNGQVVLDGASAGNQDIRTGITGIKDFYDLIIDKSAGTVRYLANGVDVSILNNLVVQNGEFRNYYNNRDLNIGGDLNCTGGTLYTAGKYVMNKASGTGFITTNSSVLLDFDINTGGTYLVQDALDVSNLFSVTAGTFNANGQTIKLGNYSDVITIAGTYIAGAGGRMEIGDRASLTVTSSGTMDLVGTSGSPVTVTRRTVNNYNFAVQGTIKAQHYLFEYMGVNGIKIENSAIIDATDNFSNGTFTNGASGGTLFNIESTQDLTGDPGRIENVVFPANPGGGASNVSKLIAGSGTVEFYDATGSFRGPIFENDPSNLIDWTGTETLTWTSGAGTSDWFTAGNWESSLGGNKVPTPTDIVIIDNTPVIQPIITVDGNVGVRAEARSLTIDFGAVLTLNTSVDDTFADLDILGDIAIDGIFITNGAEDRIKISGAWTRGASGSFSQSTCKVNFATSGGVDVINNGTSPFYDVTIESGSFQLGNNTVVQNDFTIDVGAIFNVTSSNRQLTIGADFNNAGSFDAQSGLILFNTGTVGARTIETGGDSFYNLEINGNVGATYSLQSTTAILNDFGLLGGDLSLNSNTLNMGDPVGSDIITVGGSSTLIIGSNGILSMGANTTIQVNSGATLQAVGANAANKAIINSQSGSYAFIITSGGQLDAQYYEFNNLNATGLNIQSGASLHATNNLSDGSFSNGAAGGRFLLLENDLASDITLTGVVFNSGPAVNAKRLTGANNYIFVDASGVLAGSAFEEDNPANGDTDGRIRWSYIALNTWDGSTSSDWNVASNWSLNAVPLATNNVLIPVGMPNDPVLNSGADGVAKDLTIQAGATMEFDSNGGANNLTLSGSFINSGTFTHTKGTLNVDGSWTNVGTYTAVADALTQVFLTASTGNILIETGGDPFEILFIDSDKGAGDGDAVFQTVDPIIANARFDIVDGTFQVTNPTHTITIDNTVGISVFRVQAAGTFVHGNGTVNLQTTGTEIILESLGSNLFNVVTSGSSNVLLLAAITIENNLTLGTDVNAGSANITLVGNLSNTGTFTSATSTLSLTGTATQTITSAGGIGFNNLTVNNTSAIHPQIALNDVVTVTGTLTLTDGVISSSNTDFIHVNGGTLSGGSSASYVDGPLQMTASTDLTFHVGDGLIYARIGAESLTGSNGFTAQYFDAAAPNPGNVSQGGGPLNHVSGAEYWDLARLSGTSDPLVRLYWEDGTRSDITDLTNSDLVVAHYTAGNWESEGQGVLTGTAAAGTVRSSSNLTSLSPITFGSAFNLNALPIELLSFKAEALESTVKLTWETASELNNDYFTLLKSKDGENYEEVTTIIGAGNSTEVLAYSFVDERPLNGISYYKLTQTDFDGTTAEAGVVLVKMANNSQELTLVSYPNPFNDQGLALNLSGLNSDELVEVIIVDAFGRQQYLENQQADTSGYLNFTISEVNKWDSGVYVVRVLTEKGVIQTKIIKQ